MANEFASHVEIHWPNGKIEKWSSVRVLRVNTVIGEKKEPISYLTVTLVEGQQDAKQARTSGSVGEINDSEGLNSPDL
jgi:hypothetical protein